MYKSVAESLRQHAQRQPEALAYRFLSGDDGTPNATYTFAELDLRARVVAGRLKDEGVQGKPVLILLPPGLDYVAHFFGCLYAGAIAVPVYPPDMARLGQSVQRLTAIAHDAQAACAVTTAEYLEIALSNVDQLGPLADMRWIAVDRDSTDAGTPVDFDPDALAFLQYTSGSTATPKGVMVGNGNLVHNLEAITRRLRHDSDSVGVSWLPPYHDMGLIGGILAPLYGGFASHLMAPFTFVRRPLLWLQTISEARGTSSASPNFGYELCLRRVTEEQRDSLNLISWTNALNGAEPINAGTLERFAKFFAPSGFAKRSFMPCYGLAEATLMVSGVPSEQLHTTLAGTRSVACGQPVVDTEVAIVDPDTHRRLEGAEIGEIWVSGPGVAQGYWRNPEATAEIFGAVIDGEPGKRYLRTGDLGHMHEGQLVVSGRAKDVMIVQGRNYHPNDIEFTAEGATDQIRAGHGAAFSVPVNGAEQMVVAYEVEVKALQDKESLLARLRMAISAEHQITPHAVVLLKKASLPRTSSGKIQRYACRQAFLSFGLPVVAASVVRHPVASGENAGKVEDLFGGTGRSFAELGLDYPTLLERVQLLERAAGVPLSVSDLLVKPHMDTLLAMLPKPAAQPPDEAVAGTFEIEAWLTDAVGRRLGLAASTIDVTKPFAELGLDSVQAVAIVEELGGWLGQPITSERLFDHPTIRDVALSLATPAEQAAPVEPADSRALEPIAIVGMGCRLPGAGDAESFWRLVLEGHDAIGVVPSERWDAAAVGAPAHGGFVDDIDRFDARFFGLSRREAERMDPQQRLLLEVAWQTFEDAGISPQSLAGSQTGVFVGISSHDYSDLTVPGAEVIDIHSVTGNAHSVAANRLSYLLDLLGPSLAVDTACSSSLTAVHLACQSLRAGECDLAIAGGVNLMITPGLSAAFAKAGMLSQDGRCRVFDDSASGYVRGEGAGLVCLKPLSAALADGDRVYATIVASGAAHGGRTNGLTAPKSSAQRGLIERTLARASLRPEQVGYVEAHGTGTILGDPVEWRALASTYGRDRDAADPCYVGSVKANIGHLEAAAGIAGLMKAAFVVHSRRVPPQLHLDVPNRHLSAETSGLAVPQSQLALPSRVHHAAVSSFGFGGMNAHVILRAPQTDRVVAREPHPRAVHALCLSAHTPTALSTLAHDYRPHLKEHPQARLADLAFSANTGRAHLSYRATVVGATAEEFDSALRALSKGEAHPAVVRGNARKDAPSVAFLFTGQGDQYAGMGRALYASQPVMAAALDRCDEVLRPILGVPLPQLLFEGGDRLHSTRFSQPATVALQIALAELWKSLGVRPAAVLGHSVGAYSAAYVAGVLSLEDALRLAAVRGELMGGQPGEGAMLACVGDAAVIRQACDGLAIAATNGPDHLVLSGTVVAIERARAELAGRGITAQRLAVSHAFHSPLMEGAVPGLREAAERVRFGEPKLAWISDHTGELVQKIDAGYWVRHLMGEVRFASAFDSLKSLGCQAYVEIGPASTLLGLARRLMSPQELESALWLPTLRRDGDRAETFLKSLGRLHCAGAAIDWASLDTRDRVRRVPVPHAVFERESCWVPAVKADSEIRLEHARRLWSNVEPKIINGNGHTNGHTNGRAKVTGVEPVVLEQIARVCGYPPEQIPLIARLGVDLGFDSLMKVELGRHIVSHFPIQPEGLRESLTDDPTVQEIVDLLHPLRPIVATPAAPEPRAKRERSFVDSQEYAELQERRRQAEAVGGNPYGRTHGGLHSATTIVDGKPMLNFSSFNYLALSNHPRVMQAAKEAIDVYGTSCSATPLLCGETPLHRELDAEIAGFLGTDGAIVFAGGHATNVATVGHLFGPQDLILHDEWIHDSTVRGAILSGARRRPFWHNDYRALDGMLSAMRDQHRRAVVVLEGAYSQDGDIPDLPRFIEVAKRHDAMLMVDEAHSIGVLGRTGRGIGEHFGVERSDVDLWMGTLSKGLGGLGGYIAASEPIIEYLKYTTPLYIFSTGISPANAAAALEAIRVIRDEPERAARVRQLSDHFRTAARDRGLDIGVSAESAIIPVIVGAWDKAIAISHSLLAQGINVMPIGYPAVARDKARLRFFVNFDHTEQQLEHALDVLHQALLHHTTPTDPTMAGRL